MAIQAVQAKDGREYIIDVSNELFCFSIVNRDSAVTTRMSYRWPIRYALSSCGSLTATTPALRDDPYLYARELRVI